MRRLLAPLCLALGLAACGGTEEVDSTQQAIIWDCPSGGTNSFFRRWYSDFQRTQEVGREDCYCDGTIVMHGNYGRYYAQQALNYCLPGEAL